MTCTRSPPQRRPLLLFTSMPCRSATKRPFFLVKSRALLATLAYVLLSRRRETSSAWFATAVRHPSEYHRKNATTTNRAAGCASLHPKALAISRNHAPQNHAHLDRGLRELDAQRLPDVSHSLSSSYGNQASSSGAGRANVCAASVTSSDVVALPTRS